MANKILIVDDDEMIAEIAKQVFVSAGFDVAIACNGLEAQEKVEVIRFDVIVLDVFIPAPNGIEIANFTRQSDLNAETPIIFFTGLPGVDALEQQQPSPPVVEKPCDFDHLLEVVARFCPGFVEPLKNIQ